MSGALRLERLSKRYAGGGEAALEALDLTIDEGAFVTLLGPSGCGKTTTLRLIAGYMAPDQGRIRLGERLLSAPDRVLPPEQRGMGMVFQNYAVWPHKTVFENVVFGLRLRKVAAAEARRRVEAMLALTHLEGLEQRFPSELSGGQQQRVALARSLVVEPRVLLLDEPLSNLDAKLRERMRLELKALQRRTRITFVYVTHDQAEALALSDAIAVLYRGRLQQAGAPRALYERPANRMVAELLGAVNLLQGRAEAAERIRAGPLLLRRPPPPGIAVGAAVEVAIRPESIALAPAPQPGGVAARVSERLYLGNLGEYQVTLADGQRLRVQTPALADFAPGSTVYLSVEAAQASVFPAGAGERKE